MKVIKVPNGKTDVKIYHEEVRFIASPEAAVLVMRAYQRCIASISRILGTWSRYELDEEHPPDSKELIELLKLQAEEVSQELRKAGVLEELFSRYVVAGVLAPFTQKELGDTIKTLDRLLHRSLSQDSQ